MSGALTWAGRLRTTSRPLTHRSNPVDGACPQILSRWLWPTPGQRYDWVMPLSATVDGQSLCAPLLDERAWATLRGKAIVLQPCGHPAFPRVSRLGTRHFVHERDCGSHRPESAEHLYVKAAVASSVTEAGWSAATEVPGRGFVADVLARRGDMRVAFEVQKSRQVLREYERRQATYAAAGIRCVWLVAAVPAGYQAEERLPLFTVGDWLGDPRAVVAGRTVGLSQLVDHLLAGSCRWREHVVCSSSTVEILRLLCPMCGNLRDVEVAHWLRGQCQCGLPVARQDRLAGDADRRACCGYWGPALALGRSAGSAATTEAVSAGHWCLSA